MEEQVYRKLTEEDQQLLANLKETEVFRAILRAAAVYQEDKAAHVALTADSFENVILNRGNIYGARFIVDLVKLAHKKQKKNVA